MAKTIVLKGDFVRKEVVATGAITPGHGVELDGTVAGAGTGRKAFALENDLVGKGITDAYAVGEVVQYGVCQPGAEVQAIAGAAIAANAALEFDASGRVITRTTGLLIGFAMAAAAQAGDRVRIEVA